MSSQKQMNVIYYNKGDIYNKDGMMVHVYKPQLLEDRGCGSQVSLSYTERHYQSTSQSIHKQFFKN